MCQVATPTDWVSNDAFEGVPPPIDDMTPSDTTGINVSLS